MNLHVSDERFDDNESNECRLIKHSAYRIDESVLCTTS